MGNVNSDQRTKPNETSSKGRRMTFAARQIPKYLKPTKPKERERRPSATTRSKSSSKEKAVQFADLHDEQHYDSEHHLPNMLVTGMSDDHGRDTEQSANFRWIKGRRFTDTQGINYLFPVDKPEQDRQRMQAYVLKWAFGRSFLSPVSGMLKKGCNILDIGCGVGAWAIDIALDYHKINMLAIDVVDIFLLHQGTRLAGQFHSSTSTTSLPTDNLSSNQKSASSVSQTTSDDSDVSNIRFEECNVLNGILYPNDHFHYIHQAHMAFAYTRSQWKQVLQEAARVLAPGGYIELVEVEFPGRRYGPKAADAVQKAIHVVSDQGYDAGVAVDLQELLRCTGLTDISGTYVSMPLGDWNIEGNYIGNLWRENSQIFMNSAKPWLAPALGLTSQEFTTIWNDVHDELNETKAFINVYVAWGRKPDDGCLETRWDNCAIPGWADL
ncbi:S-adenosyl-L-methionine-dependent methyltransferase [Umbelopsis sp. PMI_123]|nr:S-adenosyl-L-methionine-dependent methyltransferase [Umbelopsis sp. PMI_123]